MQLGKKIAATVVVLLAAAAFGFAGGGSESGSGVGVEAIQKAGVLKVGVKSDVPRFGLMNTATNQYEGMEIELSKLIAKEILGDAGKVAFTPVTAKTRGPLLDTGELDLVIATFTITEERKLTYNFSTKYYTDAVGMLVKKASGISGLKDCDGKTIGVAQSATSRKAIQEAADKLGIKIGFSEFATYPEIKAALDSGRVNVFSVDKSILNGYLDDTSVILPDAFSPQEYGVVSKLDNKALAAYINGLIEKWLGDGTLDGLIKRFGL
ncbi:MAG: transporter substrate-binding domain-containing protein [Spirochaetia bacterium]|jgi:putative glutamine transport system substrate-binding protein|nr:transporter substrate-binding domain-containing protein [Spirochaetia bacterium]